MSGDFCDKKCMGRGQLRDCAMKNGVCLIEDSDGFIPGGAESRPFPRSKLVPMQEAANNCSCLLSFFFAV